jgi:acetyltransferase-like isoleucine patch superfamily enzyme
VSFHRNIQRAAPTQHIGMSPGTYVQALNGLRFGRNLRLGPGSKIISADHALDDYSRHIAGPPIVLGDNVWIGANAVILPGVVLGNHVVVGAGAVVTKSFAEDDILIAGVPARKVRDLPPYSGSDQKRVGSEG